MSYEKEYVERHLGEPLTLALTDICLKRPKDPILYLGQWLLHWQRNKDQLLVRRRELEELLQERQKQMELQEEIEKETKVETEEKATEDENINDNVGDGLESTASTEGLVGESWERWSFDRSKFEQHIPVDVREQTPVIDKKLLQITSPILEIDEDNIEDETMENKKENILKRESKRWSSDRRTSERRTSVRRTSERRTSERNVEQ